MTRKNLTIVSNRLPIVLNRGPEGDGWDIQPGSGGLVTAMNPILERSGGHWIGWPGAASEELGDDRLPLDDLDLGYTLHTVPLTKDEVDLYYRGFANSIVWPLFHNFPERCSFDSDFWHTYLRVNEKFAEVLDGVLGDDQPVWVHDYHLMHLAEKLRETNQTGQIGFFLHIPFPSLENFVKLPWRAEVLRALLSYDLLGFQSTRDRRHFIDCVTRLMPDATCNGDESLARVQINGREVRVGAFPIGLDFDEWSGRAASEEVEQRARLLRREFGPYQLILGIDRLDYTKGLIEKFHALERALEKHPELIESIMLFQLVVPSRENVPEYAALKREVDRLVGRINGRFSTTSWQPIRYLYNTVDAVELAALYRLADVALVTPLCDGMNLVCKEYVSCQVEESGALILGEMAGAAAQLKDGAIFVNPHDIDGTADAIHTAVNMPEEERRERMRLMRNIVDDSNVYRWAESYLDALHSPGSLQAASEPEYLPHIDTVP